MKRATCTAWSSALRLALALVLAVGLIPAQAILTSATANATAGEEDADLNASLSSGSNDIQPMASESTYYCGINVNRGGNANVAFLNAFAEPGYYYGPTTSPTTINLRAYLNAGCSTDGLDITWSGPYLAGQEGLTAKANLPTGTLGSLEYSVSANPKTFYINYHPGMGAGSVNSYSSSTYIPHQYTYEWRYQTQIDLSDVVAAPEEGYGGDPIWRCDNYRVEIRKMPQGDREHDIAFIPAGTTGNISFSASFAKSTCTIKYDRGDGTGDAMADQVVVYGTSATLGECAYTPPPNMRFAGWLDTATGTMYQAEDILDSRDLLTDHESTLELTAQYEWIPRNDVRYTIEYHLQRNDGSWPTSATCVVENADGTTDEVKKLTDEEIQAYLDLIQPGILNPVGGGQRYVRNNGGSGKSDVLEASIKPDGSTTFKIYYKTQYRVSYSGDPSKGSVSNDCNAWRDRGEAVGASAEVVARDGYTFEGWNPAHDPADSATHAKRYQAVFSTNTYEIALDPAGGQLIATDWTLAPSGGVYHKIGGYTVEDEAFDLPIPIRKGYVFEGWELDSPARDAAKASIIEKGSFGDRRYTAVWAEEPPAKEPDGPDAPKDQDTPDKPDTPDEPDTPDSPDDPGTPGAPEDKPESPTDQDQAQKPSEALSDGQPNAQKVADAAPLAQRVTALAQTGDLNMVLAFGFAALACAAGGAALLAWRPRRAKR